MAILNYTTEVSVDRSVSEIQRILAKGGARSISTEYDDNGQPVGVGFQVLTKFGLRHFVLPANIDAIQQVLTKQYAAGQLKAHAASGKFTSREQAARVAWRIIKDWLEAQMALVQTSMVDFEQVMLPYLEVAEGRSLYAVLSEQKFMFGSDRQLPAGRDDVVEGQVIRLPAAK